jgi:hypothetical protein
MVFLVFEPPSEAGASVDPERIVFLRDKFSWPALLFGPFWLIWHGLWLGLTLWALVFLILAIGVAALELSDSMMAAAFFVPSLLVALDPLELRRRKLLRRGYREAGIVVAENLDLAEHRFFSAWATRSETAVRRAAPALRLTPPPPRPVVGLFPGAQTKP